MEYLVKKIGNNPSFFISNNHVYVTTRKSTTLSWQSSTKKAIKKEVVD